MLTNIKIRKEISSDDPQITTILDDCFGLNRLNKTVYKYRKSPPIKALSLISCFKENPIKVVGTISFYRVFVEKTDCLLLGPLSFENLLICELKDNAARLLKNHSKLLPSINYNL